MSQNTPQGKSSKYWQDRFLEIEAASNAYGMETIRQIEPAFEKAQRQIQKEIDAWYGRYAKNNQVSMDIAKKQLSSKELKELKWDVNEYIKYGRQNAIDGNWMKELENASARYHISRLEALKIRTQQAAEVAFGNELDAIDKMARKVYTEDYYKSIFTMQKGFNIGWEVGQIDERKLNTLVKKPWAADGKNFSKRVWETKGKMVSELHQQLTRACILGKAPDEAIKAMTKFVDKKVKNAQYVAGRLVMTEQAYFHSVAQKDAFNELDVEEFEIVATLDSHTSEICQEMDGQHFPMSQYEAGVTAPPFHVFCRTVTVPYFDDNFTGERAARGADGKTYYVPDNMTYKKWKQAMVGGDTSGLTVLDAEDVKDQLAATDLAALKLIKDEIMVKHDQILKTDAQKKEFSDIMQDWEKDKTNLYNLMADNFSGNLYHEKGKGWYSPWKKRIEMDLECVPWDKAVGRNVSGAWKTKFHEEMHQLDHILARQKSPFALLDGKTDQYNLMAFTSPQTAVGKKMIAAIDEDVLEIINAAVEWDNATNGSSIKKINGLGRISSDAKAATIKYLKAKYPTAKDRALIDTVTDAIGMTTSGKLHPYSKGFWGHKQAYCKSNGKTGATSEAWANIAGFLMRGETEALDAVKVLMPKTVETYTEVFDEVVEYAKSNTISYNTTK